MLNFGDNERATNVQIEFAKDRENLENADDA